ARAEGRRPRVLALAVVVSGLRHQPEDSAADSTARRWGAWLNAADANRFGEYVASSYNLDWEWVHIDKDQRMTTAVVDASHAFVDALGKSGKKPKGKPGS